MVKLWLHKQMFAPNGKGQVCVVYELGIPGDTVRDVLGRFEVEILARVPKNPDPNDVLVIFAAGTNDSRANEQPDNFFSTPDEFATNIQSFIRLAKSHAGQVLCIGLVPVNQDQTNPKQNPFTGGTSYFINQRIRQFEDAMVQACQREQATCLPLFDLAPKDWLENYLFLDGMHPNDAGHQWIFEQVKSIINERLGL